MARIRVERPAKLADLRAPEPRGMFRAENLYRVQLEKGLLLYKLTDVQAVTGRQVRRASDGFLTKWWFSYDSLSVRASGKVISIPGIAVAVERAQRTGANLSKFLRSRGAVNLFWGNPMTHLLVVSVRRPVVGLMGYASRQDRSAAHGNVQFIGGAVQLFLRGLAPADVIVHAFGPI